MENSFIILGKIYFPKLYTKNRNHKGKDFII